MPTRTDGYRSERKSRQWQRSFSVQIRTFVLATNSFRRRSPGSQHETKTKITIRSPPHKNTTTTTYSLLTGLCWIFFYSSIVVFLFVYCFLFFLVHQPPCRVRAVRKEVEDLRTPAQGATWISRQRDNYLSPFVSCVIFGGPSLQWPYLENYI